MENEKLPNANAVLILGILSIITCCCWGIVGVILGIIALVLAKKDTALYNENPSLYTNFNNINTGKILAIIGLVLSTIDLIWTIYSLIFIGQAGMMEMQQEWLRQLQNK